MMRLLLILSCMLAMAGPVLAEEPVKKPEAGKTAASPAPAVGIVRTRVGEIAVTLIQDGRGALPVSLMKGVEPAEARKLLGGKESADIVVNAFLAETGGKRILVDTGTGTDPKGETGHLLQRFVAAKIDPATIDYILITHFHYDHVGGLVKEDGSRAFPKAVIRVAQAEHDQWLSEPSRLPEYLKASLPKLKQSLAPYQAAGAYKPFAPGEAPAPGVSVLGSPGHTDGHSIFALTSKGQSVWFVGDLLHVGALQFDRPAIALIFDTNNEKAIAVRKQFFQQAAKQQALLAAAHVIQMGTLTQKGEGYTFRPLP